MKQKDLLFLYAINKIAKQIRDEIKYYQDFDLDDEDLDNIEFLNWLKKDLYDFKNEILEKIKRQAYRKEKHILMKQEDNYWDYDYYFVLLGNCYYFVDDEWVERSFHWELKKEYLINKNEIENLKEVWQIDWKLKEFVKEKIKNINMKYIIKYLEKEFGIKSYLSDFEIRILENYKLKKKSWLFCR